MVDDTHFRRAKSEAQGSEPAPASEASPTLEPTVSLSDQDLLAKAADQSDRLPAGHERVVGRYVLEHGTRDHSCGNRRSRLVRRDGYLNRIGSEVGGELTLAGRVLCKDGVASSDPGRTSFSSTTRALPRCS